MQRAGLELDGMVALELHPELQHPLQLAVALRTEEGLFKTLHDLLAACGGAHAAHELRQSPGAQLAGGFREGCETRSPKLSRQLVLQVHLGDNLAQDPLQRTVHIRITPCFTDILPKT